MVKRASVQATDTATHAASLIIGEGISRRSISAAGEAEYNKRKAAIAGGFR